MLTPARRSGDPARCCRSTSHNPTPAAGGIRQPEATIITPYNQRQEDAAIDRMLHAVVLPDAAPARIYLDPEGGYLRQVGWQKTARQQQRLVRCMGAAMAQLAAGDGACTEQDLRAHGFTLTEIAAHRDAATLYARTMGGIDV